MTTSLTPMLTVRKAAEAIAFYAKAFGAKELSRLMTPSGQIVAEMAIDGQTFGVVDENPRAFNVSPQALGGTTVRISLVVDDPDTATTRAMKAGCTEVFPIADQPYGMRQGRVQDPFGHHWLIGKRL
ncbi:MAG TPA: VOC family protein [Candidatus Limnocylindria bacterium]|nr:VOC family protein [Candidatus Limnocylindria bacterium]